MSDPRELRKQAAWYREVCRSGWQSLDLGGPTEDGDSSGARGQSVGTQVEPAPTGSRLAASRGRI
jgi:hypothetical protein